MIDYIFPFYMCLNCFIAGMYLYSLIEPDELNVKSFLVLVSTIFFGTIVLTVYLIFRALDWFLKPLQIRFFYNFYRKKIFHGIDTEVVEHLKSVSEKYWLGYSIQNIVNRFASRLIIARYEKEQSLKTNQ